LNESFARRRDKLDQWQAFLRRTAPTQVPRPFMDVLAKIRSFLGPLIDELHDKPAGIISEWRPDRG
jgi:hypothetical protein